MKYKLAIIPHTHWDREWYQTFQGFRYRLVKMIDNLLTTLENEKRFSCFMLDGQTIVIEDYLEIRPENEEKLKKYIQEGRIQIGPWYILPDEFLVSGESLVRNLIFGDRIANKFGKKMKIGYLPDQFGHSIGIPKILKGSGIDCAVVWRGVGDEINDTEFFWQGDDGSKIFTIYLIYGYCNAVELPLQDEELLDKLKVISERLIPHAKSNNLLLMNGCDHQEAQEKLPGVLEKIKDKLPYDFEITNLEKLKNEILNNVDINSLAEFKGEFRSPKRAYVLPGTLSTRVNLKQNIDEIETLLSNYVEPLSSFVHLEGLSYPENYINLAWKYMLQNQAHDSICGCSIDQVHKEMETRFNSAREICNNLLDEAAGYIASEINTEIPESKMKIAVFNFTGNKRSELIELDVNNEDKNMGIYNSDKKELFCEETGNKMKFMAEDVPGLGFKTYYLKETDKKQQKVKTDLQPGKNCFENKYYKISVNKNGSINISDKINKAIFKNCCQVEESGDAGDEYNYSPPQKDTLIMKPASVKTRFIEKGNLKTTLEITGKYYFPESLSDDRKSRKKNKKLCVIKNRISLISSISRVEFETEVENNVSDHRLRVLFPLPWKIQKSSAANHFGIIDRSTTVPKGNKDFKETPVGCFPNLGFVMAKNKNYSVCLSNIGLKEYEILNKKAIALTLLRGIGWIAKRNLALRTGCPGPEIPTPAAQMPGKHILKYSFSSGLDFMPILQSYNFRQPLFYKTLEPAKDKTPKLKNEFSFLEVEPQGIIISTIKKAEKGNSIIVRVFNTKDIELNATIKIYKNFKNISIVNLLEEKIKDLETKDGNINFKIKPNEIITLSFSN
ncbi:MAG: glycoside hydrolase family 38 C-terminal domain-containing protein [Elusimicrobia bacterium]|nr:glycoside hydrolase family 38 C-terminal domain-containing protein [Elusimicrobiota bacterium]